MKRFSSVALTLVFILTLNAGVWLLTLPGEIWRLQKWERFQNTDKKGFVSREFIDHHGATHKYVVYVPLHLKPDDRPPVILYLHGEGKRGSDGVMPLRDGLGPAIWEMKRNFPFVVLFPQEPVNEAEVTNHRNIYFQRVIQMLDKTVHEYHADPDRVSVTGLSSGGFHSWNIVDQYPNRFAAVFPFSSVCDNELIKRVILTKIPVWNFYVKGDDHKTGDCFRNLYPELIEMGFSPHFTELDGTLSDQWWKHNSWDYATRDNAFLNWLEKQRLSDQENNPQLFQPILNETDSSKWKPPESHWKLDSNGGLRVEGTTSNPINPLVYRNNLTNYELHLEFKVNAGPGCSLHFYSSTDNEFTEFLKVNIIPPEYGSGGIIQYPSQKWIAASNPIAQNAFVAKDWNDLRIRIDQDRLTVLLNGWKLYDFKDKRVLQHNGYWGLSIPEQENSSVQWRYLRLRGNDR